jgi:hypothetical protein
MIVAPLLLLLVRATAAPAVNFTELLEVGAAVPR